MAAQILFRAKESSSGFELWITDGTTNGTSALTPIGTKLLQDINPGSGSSDPSGITPLGNGEAVFAAYEVADGTELWVTDGTELWVTDGTELWVTDGTAGPGHTELLMNINPGTYTLGGGRSSFPHDITYLGGGTHKAVFAADDGTNGEELWVTDGTPGAGHTYMLYTDNGNQLAYDVNSSSPLFITPIGGGEALFQAYYAKDFTHKYGIELFITDGTSAGTKVPSLLGLSRSDHRRLGVAIKQLILHRPRLMTAFDHDAPLFAAGGCHLPELGYCWTDGEFELPAASFAHLGGAFTLIVHARRQNMRYPIAAAVGEAASPSADAA